MRHGRISPLVLHRASTINSMRSVLRHCNRPCSRVLAALCPTRHSSSKTHSSSLRCLTPTTTRHTSMTTAPVTSEPVAAPSRLFSVAVSSQPGNTANPDSQQTADTTASASVPRDESQTTRYDVIIAGAGPVGLFLACELRLAKLSVLVLEAASDPHNELKQLPFGIRGLWGPSIETLYRRGLLEAVAAQPRPQFFSGPPQPGPARSEPGSRGPAGHFAGIPLDYANIDSSRWSYRLPGPADQQLASELQYLETILTNHALSLGVDIRRGQRVEAVEQSNGRVHVRTGGQVYRGSWLVGCDGGRSTVRKQAGFEFVGHRA